MRPLIFLPLLCALVAPLAARVPPGGLPARAEQEYDALKKAFDEAQQEYFQRLSALDEEPATQPADEQRKEAAMAAVKDPTVDFTPRFRAFAEQHAGTSAAIPALGWLVTTARSASPSAEHPDADWALAALTQKHAADPAIKDVLPQFQYQAYALGAAPLIKLYEAVLKVNPDKNAQAAATFNLAFTLYSGGEINAKPDAEQLAARKKRAEDLFRQAARDYPDTDGGKRAAGYVFELEHLQIGMKAPEFVGKDADEKEIKLSQFRGQVVVLDFWGFW